MKNGKVIKNILPILMILMNLVLSVVVIVLMQHVQGLLNSDVKINLMEIVTQNKDAITSRLMMSVNSLDITSTKITDSLRSFGKNVNYQSYLESYAKTDNAKTLFVANKNGIAYFPDERQIDISGRNYFRLALSGISNISDKVISRINGEEVFVISVPLLYDNEVIGTIQKIYTLEEMYQICSLSLFSAQGYMYVINREGYIILHSGHVECFQKSDNYYRDLYAMGNHKASEQIKKDIQNKQRGFIETVIYGKDIFSAYTPIDKIHDWYLITSVPNHAVSPNGSTVITLFYVVLLVIVLIFTLSITYFLWYKNKQSENLKHIAFVDPVTGGNTYNKFLVAAHDILASNRTQQFYIMKFDIDNFKYINNFHGFEYGDQILTKINQTISRQLVQDETIARISSDHFIVLLKNAEESRIKGLLSSIEDKEVLLYFSAGIFTVTDPQGSLNLMVDKASTAAQSVKGKTNNTIAYYTDAFEQCTLQNEQMKRKVQLAIEDKEFIPYYQPKVDINTGKLVGGEALVRWKTKDGKFIYPNEFIPMCEQTGLITGIDMIVYERVLHLLRRSLDAGVECVPISVNFSRLHLQNPDFIADIVKKQKAFNIPPHLIELELTESSIFDNVERIYSFTQEMHEHGFLIAMDDFGSGYSSLNMLKDIPIDILKIDKEFLIDSGDNNRRNIIFSSIAEMARRLKIVVVVEGVEHLENVSLMRECGCSIAQGYYFARPMDEESFDKIFRAGRVETPGVAS